MKKEFQIKLALFSFLVSYHEAGFDDDDDNFSYTDEN